MKLLARIWTWTGQSFILLFLGWGIYIQIAISRKSDGVIMSHGFWGAVLTLLTSAILTWTFAFYARLAVRHQAGSLIPPNTLFEGKKRNGLVSCATLGLFLAAILAALVTFTAIYSNMLVYDWDTQTPVAFGFWSSRVMAHQTGCFLQRCFAMGPRGLASGSSGLTRYVPYLTDGILGLHILLLGSGLTFLLTTLRGARGALQPAGSLSPLNSKREAGVR